MPRVLMLHETSVGKKIAMALAGAILTGFVIGHMIGNLKVYQGAEAFNHYAEGLRTFGAPFFGHGQLLWLVRLALIFSAVVHIWYGLTLWAASKRARKVGYKKFDPLVFSAASRTMAWGGITILAFVIYHLMHMTWGNVHPDFIHGNAYHNFVTGFRSVPVVIAYVIAMIPLAFHLYHGVWSACQTLGLNNTAYNHLRRPIAGVITAIVIAGNISFPIAVLAGVIR
jgi:succinate dehydrogenase / fumarate reductase cytochrome b subunit